MSLNHQRTITTLAGVLVSVLITVSGVAILLWGIWLPADPEFVRELVKTLGSALISIGGLSFMWELFSKRTFLEETLALANMTSELKNAGIEQVSNRYLNGLQWAGMIETAQTLDVFFAYGRTWCNVNTVSLGELTHARNRSLRVLLPDPGNPQVISELARRFKSQPKDVEDAINESKSFFERLGRRPGEGTTVEVRLVAATPLFSMYLLGQRAVFSLHSHQQKIGHVPTCVVKREGLIYRYLEEEFAFLWESGTVAFHNKGTAQNGSQS